MQKIQRNRERDKETLNHLEQADWIALTIWEHDDFERAAFEIEELVIRRRTQFAQTR